MMLVSEGGPMAEVTSYDREPTPANLRSKSAAGQNAQPFALRSSRESVVAEILRLLNVPGPTTSTNEWQAPFEPLTDSERRVLRYLPTRLTGPEIAGELYVSVNTVKTHLRRIYSKLGVHRRSDAIERAHALGLLIPSPRPC
jgi:LuxR family maltose regulon positive regulatory protein